MSNICLKVTIKNKRQTKNFDLLSLFQLKNQRYGSKTVIGFSIVLTLKAVMTF